MSEIEPGVHKLLLAGVAAVVVATVIGLVVLWPPAHPRRHLVGVGPPAQLVNGTVTAVATRTCEGPLPEATAVNQCGTARVRLTSGPDRGTTTTLDITQSADQPVLSRGDHIIVGRTFDLETRTATYYFSDYQRRAPLLLLGLVFAVVVVGLGRWRGVAAIGGLVVSLLVLVRFVLPAMLDGESPVAVAIVGSSVIMVVVVYLAHGVSLRTTTAFLGTSASLLLTGGLATLFVHLARITGLASEEVTYLRATLGGVSTEGLILAGIIIGSLGVLNDVTVTQASTVWEIHRANPLAPIADVYRAAMRVGRDHIASTVYTLVLAYAGAALPLLILFTLADRHFGEVVTGELVGAEIVRTMVGSIGLVAAVPITTALAAAVIARRSLASKQ